MPNMIIRVIDAYVYITTDNGILFLLLKRAKTKMYEHLWQGVAGKIEKGVTWRDRTNTQKNVYCRSC